jgi:alpha-amylase
MRTRAGVLLLPVLAALAARAGAAQTQLPPAAATWTRGATCYEVFVRSFHDSDGDGVGDINGLIQRLDYINDGTEASDRDLGARCIWLMPVAASPSYHGYDVTNYYRINPDYGTNDDFKRLVAEAHRRGIRVLIDMVLNHSSVEHPFFKDAALNPQSPYRDWYSWSPTHPGIKSPWNAEIWHRSPSRDEFYYGLFWSGMPDLNLQNPAVMEEAGRIATFWLREMGVDGFRLDAVKHFAEAEQGRQVQHVAATHGILRAYAAHLRSVAPEVYTVGEVWDGVQAIMPYYPEQLDSYFQFEVADRIMNAVKTGAAAGLLEPSLQLQRALPANRYSPFLRNHDQTRTLTELGGDLAKAKAAATILLTLPGLPFIYYGEELGMTADKPDPRLRTPMHWSRGRAAGFTTGAPWEPLHADSLTANVEAQQGDPASILSLHRRLIHLRVQHPALADGELVPLTTSSPSVAAYLRRTADRAVLVVASLGATPAVRASISSEGGALPAGRYAVRDLLGDRAGAPLRVAGDGRLAAYVAMPALEPMKVYVFDLAR